MQHPPGSESHFLRCVLDRIYDIPAGDIRTSTELSALEVLLTNRLNLLTEERLRQRELETTAGGDYPDDRADDEIRGL